MLIIERGKIVILDVGCGDNPKGTVNVDLYVKETFHRGKTGSALHVKNIPNFVKADALHLPFGDNSFETVISSHLIEHLDEPIALIREVLRVSKERVIMFCPHRATDNPRKSINHKHFFNATWFIGILRQMKVGFKVEYSAWKGFPHNYIPLFKLPYEMKIEICKDNFKA